MKRVELCYPNFSKKAITFTIDDGNLVPDKKMIDILSPHGIRGTFNLCKAEYDGVSPAELREIYRGYEIANHCKWHPYVFKDGETYSFATEPFDSSNADESLVYQDPERPGIYRLHRPRGWRSVTTPERYIELIEEAGNELEAVFGEGTVRDFVWPFGEQASHKVQEYLASSRYRSVRKTGCMEDTTGFDLPDDLMAWSYNAHQNNLLTVAELFEAYPDDGRLKFFSFGVHSIDYERSNKWDDLRTFAEKYGDRPNDFWYATVGELFDYKAAADRLVVSEKAVNNPSDRTVYVLIDGEHCEIVAGGSVEL